MTADTNHGIITGVDCYPANQRERESILEHLKGQLCEYQEVGLDGGYDIGAVHRGLELLGINGYTAIWEYQNNAMKKGFCYEAEHERFVCVQGEYLEFQKLKTVHVFPPVPQILAPSGSMPVPINHLFIGIIRKQGPQIK